MSFCSSIVDMKLSHPTQRYSPGGGWSPTLYLTGPESPDTRPTIGPRVSLPATAFTRIPDVTGIGILVIWQSSLVPASMAQRLRTMSFGRFAATPAVPIAEYGARSAASSAASTGKCGIAPNACEGRSPTESGPTPATAAHSAQGAAGLEGSPICALAKTGNSAARRQLLTGRSSGSGNPLQGGWSPLVRATGRNCLGNPSQQVWSMIRPGN